MMLTPLRLKVLNTYVAQGSGTVLLTPSWLQYHDIKTPNCFVPTLKLRKRNSQRLRLFRHLLVLVDPFKVHRRKEIRGPGQRPAVIKRFCLLVLEFRRTPTTLLQAFSVVSFSFQNKTIAGTLPEPSIALLSSFGRGTVEESTEKKSQTCLGVSAGAISLVLPKPYYLPRSSIQNGGTNRAG